MVFERRSEPVFYAGMEYVAEGLSFAIHRAVGVKIEGETLLTKSPANHAVAYQKGGWRAALADIDPFTNYNKRCEWSAFFGGDATFVPASPGKLLRIEEEILRKLLDEGFNVPTVYNRAKYDHLVPNPVLRRIPHLLMAEIEGPNYYKIATEAANSNNMDAKPWELLGEEYGRRHVRDRPILDPVLRNFILSRKKNAAFMTDMSMRIRRKGPLASHETYLLKQKERDIHITLTDMMSQDVPDAAIPFLEKYLDENSDGVRVLQRVVDAKPWGSRLAANAALGAVYKHKPRFDYIRIYGLYQKAIRSWLESWKNDIPVEKNLFAEVKRAHQESPLAAATL